MNAVALVPALIVAIAGVVVLALSRLFPNGRLSVALCWFALLASAGSLALARPEPAPEPPARAPISAVTLDALARGTAWMAILLGVTCAALAVTAPPRRAAMRTAALLLSLAGVLAACVANDFVLVILAVPVSALAVGLEQLFEAESPRDRSSAVQGLVLNLFGAVCLVAGALLVSALARTTNFADLHALPAHGAGASEHLGGRGMRTLPLAGEIGYVLLLAGLATPLFAAPFQLAAAEVFEGATPWSMSLIAVMPRCAALVSLVRVFVEGTPRYLSTAQTALTAVALVTLLIGGSLAYWQTSLRRLIGLLVMVQSGLILLALAAACSEAAHPEAARWIDLQVPGGVGAAWLLFAVDSFALLALMGILSALERTHGHLDNLDEFAARLANDRLIGAAAVFLLFDLAGIPPLPGFWTRVAVLRSILSVSFASENDFLPHQNTGYVFFTLLTGAALMAAAAPCLSLAARILFSQVQKLQPTVEAAASQMSPALRRSGRPARFVGVAIAAAAIAFGFMPSVGLHLAARVTYRKSDQAVLAADKNAPPVKKHRRGRAAASEDSE